MKKLMVIMACMTFSLAASAQTLNVQSASEQLRKGYLNKAKDYIDKACQHESTKGDAKTWYYCGLIYSQIGGEANNPKSKYKNLAPNWADVALNAAMQCKSLDKDNEFADGNNSVLLFVGNDFYGRAVTAYNAGKYDTTMIFCEQSVKIFNECGKKDFAADSYLLAGRAANNLKDNASVLKYFKPLVRMKTKPDFKKNYVFTTLFNLYKSNKDTAEAVKLAQSYVKSCPEDYNSYMMMAEAHLMTGNLEEGNKQIENALSKTTDKPQIHAQLLAAAGATLENVGDFNGAEQRYQQSLTEDANQFIANFGLGKLFYNRAIDKLDAANNVDPLDETGLYDKLLDESKSLFRQSIPYFNSAISFIDGMTDELKAQNRVNQNNCFTALGTVYARLEMYDEQKAIKARQEALINSAQN